MTKTQYYHDRENFLEHDESVLEAIAKNANMWFSADVRIKTIRESWFRPSQRNIDEHNQAVFNADRIRRRIFHLSRLLRHKEVIRYIDMSSSFKAKQSAEILLSDCREMLAHLHSKKPALFSSRILQKKYDDGYVKVDVQISNSQGVPATDFILTNPTLKRDHKHLHLILDDLGNVLCEEEHDDD